MKAIDMHHHFVASEVIYYLSRDAISPGQDGFELAVPTAWRFVMAY